MSKFGLKYRYKGVSYLGPFAGWKIKLSEWNDHVTDIKTLMFWLVWFWKSILACLLVSDANFSYFEYFEYLQFNIELEKRYQNVEIKLRKFLPLVKLLLRCWLSRQQRPFSAESGSYCWQWHRFLFGLVAQKHELNLHFVITYTYGSKHYC